MCGRASHGTVLQQARTSSKVGQWGLVYTGLIAVDGGGQSQGRWSLLGCHGDGVAAATLFLSGHQFTSCVDMEPSLEITYL